MSIETKPPSPYEPRLREIAVAVINAVDADSAGEGPYDDIAAAIAVLRSELSGLLEAAEAVIDEWSEPGQDDPISLHSARPLREELTKWKR